MAVPHASEVLIREGDHDEENRCRAAAALRYGVRDGRERGCAYAGHAVADGADRAGDERTCTGWVGHLSLVLRIEVVPDRLSVRGELLVPVRGHLLSRQAVSDRLMRAADAIS
jgi:hypothetical protein